MNVSCIFAAAVSLSLRGESSPERLFLRFGDDSSLGPSRFSALEDCSAATPAQSSAEALAMRGQCEEERRDFEDGECTLRGS